MAKEIHLFAKILGATILKKFNWKIQMKNSNEKFKWKNQMKNSNEKFKWKILWATILLGATILGATIRDGVYESPSDFIYNSLKLSSFFKADNSSEHDWKDFFKQN